MIARDPRLRTVDASPASEDFDVPETRPEDDVFDLSKYVHAIRRRWPVILVCALVAVVFGLIRYSFTTKMYQASTTIQIERKRLSLLALGQAGWLEDWWNQEYYPTQYRLLRSRGMAERVVANLRLHEDPAFTGRQASLMPGDDATVTRLEDAVELANLAARLQGGLSVEPIRETQLVELTYVSPSPELAGRIANGYAEAFIQWGIETRATTVGQASSFLSAQIEALRAEIEDSQQKLNAYTQDLDITLDPAGEALLQRRSNLETKYNQVLAERISKESDYRQLVNLPDQVVANTASEGSVPELQTELLALEGEYDNKLSTYRPEWPEMVQLQNRINEKRDQLGRAVRDHSGKVRDQAYAEYQRARREEESLEGELKKLAEESRQYNSTALEYTSLVTHIDTKKDLLNELLKRQSQTEVASRVEGPSESNVRIVDRAVVPNAAFKPDLNSAIGQTLLIGLLIGVAIVFSIEYFDRTIKTPEELESRLRLPTLAVIPDIDETRRGRGRRFRYGSQAEYGYNYGYGYGYSYGYSARTRGPRRLFGGAKPAKQPEPAAEAEQAIELLPFYNSRLAICEAYRSLRTALLLSSAELLQVVAVTSAEPGEGKTATVTNLGVVLAQLGRKVLLIDADLRRPRLHKVFGVSNRTGLVNYLTGQVELEHLFLETKVPLLHLCPAGPIPPNPSELLSADRMLHFLSIARESFDMVLIDTPPVLPVADAVILGHQVDGVVLCARAGALTHDDAKACRERLRFEQIRLLGAVLNRYRSRPDRYRKSHKYYGTYGATYGEPAAAAEEAPSAA